MPYTIRVKGYSRKRPVSDEMKSLLEKLGAKQEIIVPSHERSFVRRRPKPEPEDEEEKEEE